MVDITFKRREVDPLIVAVDTTACDCRVYNVEDSGMYIINIDASPMDDAVNGRIDQNTMLIKWNECSRDTVVSHFNSKGKSFMLSGFTINGQSYFPLEVDTGHIFCFSGDSYCFPRIRIELKSCRNVVV